MLIVWNSAGADIQELSRVAETVLKSGCVYVCAFGEGCERLHDIFDETIVAWEAIPEERPVDTGNWPERHIMTTWHEKEPPEDAIWFFLNNSFVEEELSEECRAGVVISIGALPEQVRTIRSALTQPDEFIEAWLEGNKN
ncbi:MAG: hypothetical protein IPM63_14705 [Acidobacteriota bacterium]|nr:MAG: hypothetical protein IPM63_14705 [Acidobacteriota bacterium]